MKPPSRHHPPCAVIVKSYFKDSRSTSQALHHPLPSWWLNYALAFSASMNRPCAPTWIFMSALENLPKFHRKRPHFHTHIGTLE
ncbi:hypothetical protein RchiOBHm_Chr7g0180001 [Rosa chinensis]|uniref:Uncharacterized protein n=1 Tax=Rosa chinensis TaxID=74649 RepID=A0A2P6P281_ROSCH|nr:hypothetical protein RchiOBHm_Chr7g0180001 [Rosa chinensis]